MNKLEVLGILAIAAFLTLAGLSIIVKTAPSYSPVELQPTPSPSIQATATPTPTPIVQEAKTVRLAVKGGYYDPRTITVSKGTRLRIEADPNTFRGCMTTILFPDFGVSKRITPSDNVVEFVADKTGSFPFSCPMGMGQGTLVVTP
ncbi:MAG: cupredoxin domain-containing protein [Candidatus Micrarchaeota archaeon]